MNWLANDPPSHPTESSFCALGRYAKLSLLLSNYKYCHKPTIRAHNIPPAPSRSSYMNTSYCGPLTFASAACRPKADSYSRASRQLRPSPCIVRRLPSTIWRIMLKRTAIQYPSVHVSADEAWQYCSGIWTNHISLGRRVYDPSGRFLHLARFYQIISSKYPILSTYLSYPPL